MLANNVQVKEIKWTNLTTIIKQNDLANEYLSFDIIYSVDNSFAVVFSEKSLIVINQRNDIVYRQIIKKEEKLKGVKTYCRKICLYITGKDNNYISILDYQNFTDNHEFIFKEKIIDYHYYDQYYCDFNCFGSGCLEHVDHINDNKRKFESDGRTRIFLLTENYECQYIVDYNDKSKEVIDLSIYDVDFNLEKFRIEFEPENGFYYLISTRGYIMFFNINNYCSNDETLNYNIKYNLHFNNKQELEDSSSEKISSEMIINTSSNNLVSSKNRIVKFIKNCTLRLLSEVFNFVLLFFNEKGMDKIWYLQSTKSSKFTSIKVHSLQDFILADVFVKENSNDGCDVYYLGLNKKTNLLEIRKSSLKEDIGEKQEKINFHGVKVLGKADNIYLAKMIKMWNFRQEGVNFSKIVVNFLLKKDTSIQGSLMICSFEEENNIIKDLLNKEISVKNYLAQGKIKIELNSQGEYVLSDDLNVNLEGIFLFSK